MMVAVLSAVLVLAQAAQAAPTGQTTSADAAAPQAEGSIATPASAEGCPETSGDSTTIVICTQRPQGYRLNPDILEAKREMKNSSRPVRPNGAPRPDCATVGPAPCVSAGINLVAAALTAAQMAERLAKGQEVGSMFVTDPQPDEYHRYLAAKERREAEQAQQAAMAKSKAAAAAAQASAQPAAN